MEPGRVFYRNLVLSMEGIWIRGFPGIMISLFTIAFEVSVHPDRRVEEKMLIVHVVLLN